MKIVDVNTLNVVDKVWYTIYPEYGLNIHFIYPLLKEYTVTRITPKRTKIVLNDGFEITKDMFFRLIIPNEEDFEKSGVERAFNNTRRLSDKFRAHARRTNSNLIKQEYVR